MELQQNDQSEDTTAMEHLQFDLEMDAITETAVFYSTPRKSLRGRRKKTMDGRSQLQTSLLKSNYSTNAEQKIAPKYRPIWPKPYQPSFLNKPKIFGLPSTMNEFSALNSASRIIVTTTMPSKEKIQDCTTLSKPNKRTRNYSKSITGNSNSLKLLTKENGNEKNNNKNNATSRKEFSFIKMQDRDNKGSIELFFESMAQTVLSLPMHVQAEIKMEICKLVTMAEIKYSSTQSKHDCKID
ncbi:uncharacterized protein LOC118447145 [Vespa mandarinia]|uniref:uncharacterized protein LOC118447145 n=1 Tax=Vespa mandarinia TaxID=7446 RepID=UPI0016178B43|nr:uncharacterized protein LOC118447145 [Vespa mandarinia]XP_035734596.1 uncharacterized protein LOC118447145 [Vespa mandarinia]